MGDDIGSGSVTDDSSVTDCHLRSDSNLLSSTKLPYGENQNKPFYWFRCHHPLITQLSKYDMIRFCNWKFVIFSWLNQSRVRRGWKKLRHLFYTKSHFVLLLWFFHPLIVIKWQNLLKVHRDLWVFKHKKQQFSCQNRIYNWLVPKL